MIGLISPSSLSAQSALTDETAFEVIFREIRHIEADAATFELKGTSASDFRNRYKVLFNLDDSSDRTLKAVAHSCLSETELLDARAAQLISGIKDKYRPKYRQTERAPAVPPIPAELLALQQQKTTTVRKWLDVLEKQLGRGRMALLAANVRGHISSHSVVETPKSMR